MASPARERPSLASFWNDLPRDGKFLLSTVAVETLGTGLVLPFGFIYLNEVRGFTIETAGSLLAVPAIVGMAVVGPAGALIDRLGARRIILAGMTAQMLGNVLLAFSTTPVMAAVALGLLGAAGGIFWPGFNAMIGAVVPSAIRQRYFGINFTLVNLGIGIGGLLAGVHRGRASTGHLRCHLSGECPQLPGAPCRSPRAPSTGERQSRPPGQRDRRLTGAGVLPGHPA